ncbi:hypothetical protein EFB08_06635 [Rufibacter latericius]|uniref:Uncharacterized protein n=1 Tax=Rufibacter latericius TaxID=2487040 RepID=A0A3M9MW26_9BACT|nr:hypothetical protein EFB08_06635 [Rufibacter latericius]
METKEIEDAILNRTPSFAYVYLLPNAAKTSIYLQLVLGTQETGLVSVSMPPKFKMLGLENGGTIKKGNLKEYVSYIKN